MCTSISGKVHDPYLYIYIYSSLIKGPLLIMNISELRKFACQLLYNSEGGSI